jgi:sulfide:quinone oxidoreductase
VAGSGVGAVETVLALRALASPIEIDIELITRDDHLAYRPLAVVEPFGYPAPYRLPLHRLERTHRVHHRRGTVEHVDAGAHEIILTGGDALTFDALVVATGALSKSWLPGALTFRGSEEVDDYRGLLAQIEAGTVDRLLFAVPPTASWTLPLYELALLTTAWIADRGIIGVDLTIAIPQPEPLPFLGPSAGRVVRDILGNRGIRLLTGAQVESLGHNGASLADGRTVAADRVVTLPRLVGNPPSGIPVDEDGFIRIDEHGAVAEVRDVYAVGDVTSYPVRQGSVAAHQADAAAAAIAAGLGSAVEPAPFDRTVQTVLLTGVAARYLQADLSATDAVSSTVALHPLWWPPEKIAARYLAPYLAEQHDLMAIPELADRAPQVARHPERDHEEQRRLALEFAHEDAALGDHRSALRWLEILEWLDGVLRPEHAELRERWQRAAGA